MTRYLDLAEYLWLSEQVTGVSAEVLAKSGRIDLADSALHAPMAGFGEDDFYPDIVDKAAVLCWRLARNHPLPDGNKRAAWAALVIFITSTAAAGTPILPTSTRQPSPTGYDSESSSIEPRQPELSHSLSKNKSGRGVPNGRTSRQSFRDKGHVEEGVAVAHS